MLRGAHALFKDSVVYSASSALAAENVYVPIEGVRLALYDSGASITHQDGARDKLSLTEAKAVVDLARTAKSLSL
jgi:hypothetical protein